MRISVLYHIVGIHQDRHDDRSRMLWVERRETTRLMSKTSACTEKSCQCLACFWLAEYSHQWMFLSFLLCVDDYLCWHLVHRLHNWPFSRRICFLFGTTAASIIDGRVLSFDQFQTRMATASSSSENFALDDFETLLAALTGDELDKINDLVDPEVPISLRLVSSSNCFYI